MKKLLLVRAPGLSPEHAVRGDMAWNVSDLIADGSFAPLSGAPDLTAAIGALGKDQVTVIEMPFKDGPSFDVALGRLRERAGGSFIVIVSESVFISQRHFPEIKPGAKVPAGDVPRLLAAVLRG